MPECPEVKIEDNIAYCNKLGCVCHCFYCAWKALCPGAAECSQKKYSLIEGADTIYSKASAKLTKIIRSLKGNIPVSEFYSGLLYIREDGLTYSLAKSPADIIEAFLANKYLKNAGSIPDITPVITEQMEKFKFLLVYRNLFDGYAKKIKSGDLQVYATEKGQSELLTIQSNPAKFVTNSINSIKKLRNVEDPSDIPHEERLICYTKKMAPVLKWCTKNAVSPNLDQLTIMIDKNNGQVILENPGFSVVYPMSTFSWDNMFKPILRYAYKQSEIRETFDKYKKHLYSSTKIQRVFPFHFRVEALLAQEKNLWYLDFSLPDETAPWPINFDGKSMYGSTLLMYAIMSTHVGTETPRHKAGWNFEEKVMVEFIDRNYIILAKDKETEAGEIDLLVKKDNNVWLIEAKDYTLWYDDWFASSDFFKARQADLEGSFARMEGKLIWVQNNRSLFNINDEQIRGAVVSSSYEEAALPKNVVMSTIHDLDRLFGPPKFKSFHQTCYENAKSFEKSLGDYFKAPGIHPRMCPLHPECVYLEVDQQIADPQVLLNMLQSPLGIQPCPSNKGLCMWSHFCKLSIDPCSAASANPVHSQP